METSFADRVIADVEQKTHGRGNRTRKTLVLAASLVAFCASGLWLVSAEFLLIGTVVILVHEIGHLAGMRALGYRDLAMVFIPFFGGAATGLTVRPRGSHAVMVALLGPLPGLAIGLLLALAARASGADILAHWSMGFIIINGFNLLPVYPLDGGRVVQELVCRRRPVLDALLKVSGAFVLAAIAVFTFSIPTALLALLTFVCARSDFSNARLGQRYSQLARDSRDPSCAIPSDYVQAVLPEVKRRAGCLAGDVDHIADEIVMLWQQSAHVPPSRLASFGLLLFYLGAMALALTATMLGLQAASA